MTCLDDLLHVAAKFASGLLYASLLNSQLTRPAFSTNKNSAKNVINRYSDHAVRVCLDPPRMQTQFNRSWSFLPVGAAAAERAVTMTRLLSLLSAYFLVVSVCSQDAQPEQKTCVVSADGSMDPSCMAGATLDDYTTPLPGETAEGLYPVSYGEAQQVLGEESPKTRMRLVEMQKYMEEHVLHNETLGDAIEGCHVRHNSCAFWAAIGECEANPAYMLVNCAPVCFSCDKLAFHLRCPFDKEAAQVENVWKPGDLNRMFERITTDAEMQAYEPRVLSRPGGSAATESESGNADEGVLDGPWVVVFENFLSDEECETLIKLGGDRGYEISRDVGAKKFDGTYDGVTSDGRTSTNAWCIEECFNSSITKRVLEKIENVTGVPDPNSEYLQLLRYEVNQFYNTHHDYIPHHVDRAQGPRILTVFLYLNDVEAGGGTDFPRLDLTVMPKRGRALLWPSVLDSDPNAKDGRTEHQALPVEAGIKYGANAWLHLRDFKEPYARNCI